ncbi:MAG: tRNA (adenosine(37)-N6)-threonylcarbamoyltransferase complex ATPase subunit type 1 TsaE [Endomicrobiia bacterium]
MYYISSSLETTYSIASKLIKKLYNKHHIIFILLQGNLGSGKTEFVKGIIKELKIKLEKIKSPSFIIINEYTKKNLVLYHIDLYRIEKNFVNRILNDLIEELPCCEKIIFCIEWSEKLNKKIYKLFKNFKKSAVVKVKINFLNQTKRKIWIKNI